MLRKRKRLIDERIPFFMRGEWIDSSKMKAEFLHSVIEEVLALSVVKKGEQEIEGITDKFVDRRLGPKRATKIRRFFNLTKDDDVSPPFV